MFRFLFFLLAAASFCAAAAVEGYPLAHDSSLVAHDPSIIKVGEFYYLFKGGVHIPFYKSKNLGSGWKPMGTVLRADSIIEKDNNHRPWAPSVIRKGDTFYCFYAISQRGTNDSAIGVATTKHIESNDWTDHKAIITTGTGLSPKDDPFKGSNAIDPHVFIDHPNGGKAYLNYGSFYSGIWQVPLTDDLLDIDNPKKGDVKLLATTNSKKRNDVEGSFMSHRNGYYYLWFSRGRCCHFKDPENLPDEGECVYLLHTCVV